MGLTAERGSFAGERSEPINSEPINTALELWPLTDDGAHTIEHWFDDPEVRLRLGPRDWIHRALRIMRGTRPGEVFEGRTVLRAHGWVVTDGGAPVAYIGGDVYDRWRDAPLEVSMGMGYVVDPARRRRGYGRAAVLAMLAHPDLADVARFYCGVDADNVASRRCVASAGFELVDPVPDEDDTVYYRRGRLT